MKKEAIWTLKEIIIGVLLCLTIGFCLGWLYRGII